MVSNLALGVWLGGRRGRRGRRARRGRHGRRAQRDRRARRGRRTRRDRRGRRTRTFERKASRCRWCGSFKLHVVAIPKQYSHLRFIMYALTLWSSPVNAGNADPHKPIEACLCVSASNVSRKHTQRAQMFGTVLQYVSHEIRTTQNGRERVSV